MPFASHKVIRIDVDYDLYTLWGVAEEGFAYGGDRGVRG